MSNLDEIFTVAVRLVQEAGSIVQSKSFEPRDAACKSCDVDLVTEWDKKVEDLLVGGLSKNFPDHKFIGEEDCSEKKKIELTDAPTWVIDPIDGTMNFVHGFPHTCISVALLMNKEPIIGIVYNPIVHQLFTAKKGQGAYLNGAPIRVSGQTELSKSLLTTETGTSRDQERMKVFYKNITNLTPLLRGIRMLGSAALNMSMVALGGADIYFEFGIYAWDIAAAAVIVREAGGVCIDPSGGPLDLLSRRAVCAATMELAQKFCKELVQYYPERM